jgi:hypothetical protein
VPPSAAITFISSKIAARGEQTSAVGCAERAFHPGRTCHNVFDVHEPLTKITTAGTVITA